MSDFKHRLEEGDEYYAEIWHAAHKLAAEELPRIKSGLCQQPGLAATLANFAVSEVNKIIDKSNEIE
jgi:hypothetical protein